MQSLAWEQILYIFNAGRQQVRIGVILALLGIVAVWFRQSSTIRAATVAVLRLHTQVELDGVGAGARTSGQSRTRSDTSVERYSSTCSWNHAAFDARELLLRPQSRVRLGAHGPRIRRRRRGRRRRRRWRGRRRRRRRAEAGPAVEATEAEATAAAATEAAARAAAATEVAAMAVVAAAAATCSTQPVALSSLSTSAVESRSCGDRNTRRGPPRRLIVDAFAPSTLADCPAGGAKAASAFSPLVIHNAARPRRRSLWWRRRGHGDARGVDLLAALRS